MVLKITNNTSYKVFYFTMLKKFKKYRKHCLILTGLFCFIFLVISTSYADHQRTIAYIGFSTDKPFWVNLGKAVQREARQRDMILIDLTPPTADIELQIKFLEHAIEQQVDGIILGANSPTLLTKSLDKAALNKIPVVAIDTDINHPAIKSLVATDNVAGADLAGRYIAQRTGGKGTILILGGTKNHPNGEARRNGVTQRAEEAGMKVLFRRADWDDEKAFKITIEELGKQNDISAIFACWDPGIDTASHVVAKKFADRKLILVGFDGLDRTVNYIRQGKVTATIAQATHTMGKASVEIVEQVISGDEFSSKILIRPYLVDYQYLVRNE